MVDVHEGDQQYEYPYLSKKVDFKDLFFFSTLFILPWFVVHLLIPIE